MKQFMDKDFLLNSDTASKLFHEYAENAPIIDYHCHISPKEIAENRHFKNITEVWLGGDHYKWRFMRSCGVEERYITGDADDKDKFLKWAECLGKAIGNPLYHWSHLELQRYFDFNKPLSSKTAQEAWEVCNEVLNRPDMGAKDIIMRSGVTLICTTDDPIDSLEFHDEIRKDSEFTARVLPAWRPDRAMNIEKPDFVEYIEKLARVSGVKIDSFEDLIEALRKRMDFFSDMGCVLSDHGLEFVMYAPSSENEVERIFASRLAGSAVSREEELKYKFAFMQALAKEYVKKNWVMQLHYGCKRDNNKPRFRELGPDTGFDCINDNTPSTQLADFLNALEETDSLPKTILYSLNPSDNAAIGTILGCFQDSSAVAKIQQGSAWWFNDHKPGMTEQLRSLAALGNLSGFVGMLTDSRSFLSYTRHEYFRRILCNMFGELVENGEFPEDYDILGEIVKDISYNNSIDYFGFSLEKI
ncbi:MAG: glucuronate isomerase [Lachnospiraceae bacterium]|nr:glucuronate isomerase [Lachnospiraceae bacterium]